jgi:ribosomal protein S18 acetylase RimI-like enzyme
MEIDNEEPTPDVQIRAATPSDAELIATVHVASWLESYGGLMPQMMLSGISARHRTEHWMQLLSEAANPVRTSVFVAEHEGAVVGFASSNEQRDRALLTQGFTGEISCIYVLRSAQSRGIGGQLMAVSARALRDQGHQMASLWVLKSNHRARTFYERLGGEVIGEKKDHREDITLIELAYGWRTLSILAAR